MKLWLKVLPMSQTNVFSVRVYCLDLPFAVGDGYYRRGEGAEHLVGYVIEPWFRGCMVARQLYYLSSWHMLSR